MREGWKIKTLDELFAVKSSKRVHQADWKTKGVAFYRAREVVKLAQNGHVDNELFISEELFQEFTKEKGAPKEGDIIISAVGTLGQCYLVKKNDRFYFKDASVLWLENTSKVNTRYIDFAFKSDIIIEQVMDKSMGATVGTLTISRAKIIKIPIPPLEEQQQIVAILDQAFQALDQAKANIEKNISNAKELFQSKLNDIFSQKGDGWDEKSLGEIADVNYGYTDRSKSEGDFRYIRITDIDNNGELDKTGKVYIKSTSESLNFILKENDLLMARTGATFAKVLLYKDDEPSIFASYLIKISFTVDIINELYWYFTKSGYYWEQANNLSSGSAQPHFNGAALKKLKFSYPIDTEKQKELIEIIKGFDITSKEIVSLYKQKLNNLEDLKKSILQKAFTGELTNKEVDV
jgi:type I restriction enzyme S subunit